MPFSHSAYKGYVEGPLGFPMREKLAREVETVLKEAPKGEEYEYRRIAKAPGKIDLAEGSRKDVSTITTDTVDHAREVVYAKGVDRSKYNGVVPWAHDYESLPVGVCEWIKPNEEKNGLIAQTRYLDKPEGWASDWFADAVFDSMKQGLKLAKSIGFVPLSYRQPTAAEVEKRPELNEGRSAVYIIDRCVLLEYSVVPIPCNADAQLIAISKGQKDDAAFEAIKAAAKEIAEKGFGQIAGELLKPDEKAEPKPEPSAPPAPEEKAPQVVIVRMVSAEAIRKAVRERFAPNEQAIAKAIEHAVADKIDKIMGRI